MATQTVSNYTLRIPISNYGSTAFILCIEPWADEYTVGPDQKYVVTFDSEQPGDPEIVCNEQRLTLYGWVGCTKQVEEL